MLENYYKPTPKKWLRLSLALRGVIGTIAGSAFAQGNKDLAFWMLVAGAVIEGAIQFFADDDQPKHPNYIMRVLLVLVAFTWLSSCRSTKTLSDTFYGSKSSVEKLDTTWYEKKLVDVPVSGGATPYVNNDSLRKVIDYLMANQLIGPRDTLRIKDSAGLYELQYWKDAAGQLMARCVGNDRMAQTMVDQMNRLVKEKSSDAQVLTKNTVKTVFKTPKWVYWTAGIILVVVILGAIYCWWKLKRLPLSMASRIINEPNT